MVREVPGSELVPCSLRRRPLLVFAIRSPIFSRAQGSKALAFRGMENWEAERGHVFYEAPGQTIFSGDSAQAR